jgi:hypothetical protein
MKTVQAKLALYALGSVLAVVSGTVTANDANSSKFSKPYDNRVVFWNRVGTIKNGQSFTRLRKAPECCLTIGFLR